jgi:hypothetical protein
VACSYLNRNSSRLDGRLTLPLALSSFSPLLRRSDCCDHASSLSLSSSPFRAAWHLLRYVLFLLSPRAVLSSLAGSSFDHILSSSSLPAATLTDLLGLLRPGGRLVIAVQGGAAEEAAKMDLILSGFVDVAAAAKSGDSVELVAQRPPWAENASVPLNLKKKAVPAPAASAPAKDVWNLAADDTNDLDLVGEDDLLARDPVVLPVKVAADCGPAAEGQKKKACKNCSCGLAEQQQAEEKGGAQFSNAKPISSCGSVSGSCDIVRVPGHWLRIADVHCSRLLVPYLVWPRRCLSMCHLPVPRQACVRHVDNRRGEASAVIFCLVVDPFAYTFHASIQI